ncbi:MAG TPA: hypothetical protein VFS78_00065, partial [Vicinamibacteria bacterium]|nr:hypothetical protein [Vicinamibacteria bacterium]
MSPCPPRALRVAALAALLLSPASAEPAADPTLRVDLGAGVYMDLVLVKAGTFREGSPPGEAGRGDDESARGVTISRDFYVGKYPVTRGRRVRAWRDDLPRLLRREVPGH